MSIEFISIFFLYITCINIKTRRLPHPTSSLHSQLGVSSSSSPAPFSSLSPRRLVLTGMPIAKILGVSSRMRSAQGHRKCFDHSDAARRQDRDAAGRFYRRSSLPPPPTGAPPARAPPTGSTSSRLRPPLPGGSPSPPTARLRPTRVGLPPPPRRGSRW
jgi:hypothetical protein